MKIAQAFRFFRKNVDPAADHDPADLGTAFGMEATLESELEWTRPNSGYELESQARGPSTESPLAWLSRKA